MGVLAVVPLTVHCERADVHSGVPSQAYLSSKMGLPRPDLEAARGADLQLHALLKLERVCDVCMCALCVISGPSHRP